MIVALSEIMRPIHPRWPLGSFGGFRLGISACWQACILAVLFIVLSPTFLEHLCFVSPKEIPKREGVESAFVLILSQFQIFKHILDHSVLYVLASHRNYFESKVTTCKHLTSFCIKNSKHLHSQDYLGLLKIFSNEI